MATAPRKTPGMRERSPGVWELFVQAGVDPVTGKRRQVSRVFRGNLRDAKKARAELLTEAEKGRHTGTAATVDQRWSDSDLARDLAHQLGGLSTILQLHFRKEEEILLPVLDAILTATDAAALFARMGEIAHH